MFLQLEIIIADSNTHFWQNPHLISSDIMVLKQFHRLLLLLLDLPFLSY